MMKVTSIAAQSGGRGENLDQVKQSLTRWRYARKRGEHIPGALWAAAVGLAREHGPERVALELRVDFGRLKKRLEPGTTVPACSKPEVQFVELFASAAGYGATPRCECVVEMQNSRGAKMRIELNGNGLASLSSLGSAFWSAP